MKGARPEAPRARWERVRIDVKQLLTAGFKGVVTYVTGDAAKAVAAGADAAKAFGFDPLKPEEAAQALLSGALAEALGKACALAAFDPGVDLERLSAVEPGRIAEGALAEGGGGAGPEGVAPPRGERGSGAEREIRTVLLNAVTGVADADLWAILWATSRAPRRSFVGSTGCRKIKRPPSASTTG